MPLATGEQVDASVRHDDGNVVKGGISDAAHEPGLPTSSMLYEMLESRADTRAHKAGYSVSRM